MNNEFGLPQDQSAEIEALKQQLAAANAKLAAAAGDEERANEGKGPIDSQGFPKVYSRVTVFEGSGSQDLTYAPVSVNGYAIKITRGAEVIIPNAFVEALKHAEQEVTVKGENGLVTRPALRYPFTVHGPATEEEFLAFRAKMREQGKQLEAR